MNTQRRKLLKSTSAVVASTATLGMAPSLVSAACSSRHATKSTMALPGSGLHVMLTSEASGTYVTITNYQQEPVALRHIYPGKVADASGTFDINSLLVDGPKTLHPAKPWTSLIKPLVAKASAVTPTGTHKPIKVTVVTHNTTAEGPQLVETTRALLV